MDTLVFQEYTSYSPWNALFISFAILATFYIVIMSSTTLADLTEGTKKEKIVTGTIQLVLIAAVIASLFAVFASAAEGSKVNKANQETFHSWVNENYAVDVSDDQARELMGVPGYIISNPEVQYAAESDKIEELPAVVVKDNKDGLIKVQLVWDGDKFVLIQNGGEEVDKR